MNKTSEGTLEVGCIWAIFLRFVTLSDIWDGRTRETGAEWSVLEGSVLGGGRGEIWRLVDWEAGRHLDGDEEGRRWRKERKKILEICPADGLSRSGRKTVKAEFRSLPSSTDPSKKSHFIRLSSSSHKYE